MAPFVVNSRARFARIFILTESSQLRSSPLLEAAERSNNGANNLLRDPFRETNLWVVQESKNYDFQ